MGDLPIKEGTTPLEFFAVWGNAFRECFKEADKHRATNADAFRKLMHVCADAIFVLRGSPMKFHNNTDALIASLEAFKKRFQTEVIEQGGNVHQAKRRIDIIQSTIDEIKTPKAGVQIGMF